MPCKAAGLREKVKVMVGGAPVTEEYAIHVGADGYAAMPTRQPGSRSISCQPRNIHLCPAADHGPLPRPSPRSPGRELRCQTGAQAAGQACHDLPGARAGGPAPPGTRSCAALRVGPRRGRDQGNDHGGGYFDLIDEYDIDGVMVAPEYRKRNWATAFSWTNGAPCVGSGRTIMPCPWTIRRRSSRPPTLSAGRRRTLMTPFAMSNPGGRGTLWWPARHHFADA